MLPGASQGGRANARDKVSCFHEESQKNGTRETKTIQNVLPALLQAAAAGAAGKPALKGTSAGQIHMPPLLCSRLGLLAAGPALASNSAAAWPWQAPEPHRLGQAPGHSGLTPVWEKEG